MLTHSRVAHRTVQLGADNVDIRAVGGGQWEMKLKKGAVIHIPKAKKFDRLVAGQVPDGWDALRYVAVTHACMHACMFDCECVCTVGVVHVTNIHAECWRG